MRWSYPADIWSIGCILVELYTGEAIFQTHEDREHLAMMEKVLGHIPESLVFKCWYVREIQTNTFSSCVIHCSRTFSPYSFSSHSRRYFTDKLVLDWPRIARSRSSQEFVDHMKPLGYLCFRSKSSANEEFYQFVRKLLTYDPKQRITASEALLDPFLK